MRLIDWIAQIGADPGDDPELARGKRFLVGASVLVAGLSVFWISLYWVFHEPLAAAIPFFYMLLSVGSLAVFAKTHRFRWLRNSQLGLILLLPVALQLVLGGFLSSSAVVLWSLVAPLGALIFASHHARRWFVAYAALVVASGFLQTWVGTGNNLPESVMLSFFVMNILGVSLVAFVLLAAFVDQLNVERGKSESLLLNILPARIAARLKDQPDRVIAERFEAASILFADVVGFTPLSAGLAPEELVEILNETFSHFDDLADKYGVEKIKTIGDSYMVAAGVPTPRDDHAITLANMALEIRTYCVEHPALAETPLRFRIGINSGPLVAGVIGRRKFTYDLWGDTVNTASRMESHGEAEQIQLTHSAYLLLKDDFVCEPRGVVEIKGKGPMSTWYLMGARPGSK